MRTGIRTSDTSPTALLIAGATLVAGCYLDEPHPGEGNALLHAEVDLTPLLAETILWMGQGIDSEDCDELDPGQIHWVLTNPQGLIEDAELEIDGEGTFGPEPSPANVFHFFTDFEFTDIVDLLGAARAVVLAGEAHPNAQLVVSAFCPSDDGDDKKKKKKVVLKGKKRIKGLAWYEVYDALADWKIDVYEYAGKNSSRLIDSSYTDSFGEWSVKLHSRDCEGYKLAVCEDRSKGWKQLFPAKGDSGTVKVHGRICHYVDLSHEDMCDGYGKIIVDGLDFKNVVRGKCGDAR